MADPALIKRINSLLEDYFEKQEVKTIVPVKELMPTFVAAGVFAKDHKKGLPIRRLLRKLDQNGELKLIPYVHAQRQETDVYWYFIPTDMEAPTTPYKQQVKKVDPALKLAARSKRDESYVIDLCDEILEKKADRQKRFPFLLGDVHKDGKTQTRLPVDAYYSGLKLVVEFQEAKHFESIPHLDMSNKKTISGVNRASQRKIYDSRKATVLPENDISLVVITYRDFEFDESNRIIRNETKDLEVVRAKLMDFLPTSE